MSSTSHSNLAVSLRGVTKRFGSQTAVNGVDLAIHDGSIHGIIGPNGSGKTTILRMILRIYRPDSGSVTVLGNAHGEAADDRVGYLPEERGLYHRMKVRDVLKYFARLKGHNRPDPDINHWLEKLDSQMPFVTELGKAVVADPDADSRKDRAGYAMVSRPSGSWCLWTQNLVRPSRFLRHRFLTPADRRPALTPALPSACENES